MVVGDDWKRLWQQEENQTLRRLCYLWGAGATQAEAQHLGAKVSLLMRDTKPFGRE